MRGQDIICVAPTEWSGAWQRYQEMMRRLAEAGNDVLVIENLFRVGPPPLRTGRSLARAAAKAWRTLGQLRPTPQRVAERVAVLSLPPVPIGRWSELSWRVLRTALTRWHRVYATRPPVLWCAFPSPLAQRLIDLLQPGVIVYDCASAFAFDPWVPPAVLGAERELLQRADVVFTDSRGLWEQFSQRHGNCHRIPTGIAAAQFARARPLSRDTSPPVVGYVGTLHAWMDVDLIAAVARMHPDWRFVFVGPRRLRAELDAIERLPNVRFTGPRPHDALPQVVSQFHVGWIPYRITEFTRYVFPTKLLEYLAAGLPVVSTDLPEVRAFSPPVRIGTAPSEIAAHLASALREDPDERGRQLAQTYDWAGQMAQVHQHLDRLVAAPSPLS